MNSRLTRRLWRVAVDPLVVIIASGFSLLYPAKLAVLLIVLL